jgi:hypothetical protein
MLADTNSFPAPKAAPSPVTRLRNADRARYRTVAVDTPTLYQFVVLSMLLHLLLIVLFGNPTGGARREEAWWGPLDVTLRPPAPEPGPEFRLAPGMEINTPSSNLAQPAGAATNPVPAPPRRATESAPAPAPSGETLPRLNPSAPEEVNKMLSPPAESPATTEPITPPVLPRALAPATQLPPPAVPALPVVPIEKAVAPRSESELAPPVELAPRPAPAAPAAPLERIAPPNERELAPAVEVPPREAPAAPATPLERLSPAPLEREVAPAVELPLRPTPMVPVAPIEPLAPARIESEVAPPIQAPTPGIERPVPPLAPSAQPAASPLQGQTPQRLPGPEANEDIFKSRRDTGTPSTEAPHIDLDAARKKAAREIVSEGAGSRGVFTVPSPPSVKPKKEAMPLEKALKPDCRTAYANMGLLAAPVLIASAVAADGGCRW